MKRLVLPLVVLGVPAAAQSTGSVRGLVLDAVTNKPVDYATVSLYADSAAAPSDGAVTDEAGRFVLTGPVPGRYYLVADFLGYRRDTLRRSGGARSAGALDTLRLWPQGKLLAGVTVVGRAPVVETKIDKIVYNAANDVTAQGSTTLDLLRKVPQVTVDVDGNVELQGNPNIRFLINGKPSSIFGTSLADALAAIPASQIARIEAITTPGARYDAQGTGGIINILLKGSKVQGSNGTLSLSAGTRLENGSLTANLRRGTWGINAFASGNAQRVSRTPSTQDRLSTDAASLATTRLLQDGYSDFERSGYQAGIGIDWAAAKRTHFSGGASYNAFSSRNQSVIGQQSIVEDAAGTALSTLRALRNADSRSQSASVDWNLAYGRTFAKEGQALDVAYSSSFGMPSASYVQVQTEAGQSTPYTGSVSRSPGTDRQTNLSVDYAHPLQGAVVEGGLKTVLQDISSSAAVSTLRAGGSDYVADPTQSFQLRYKLAVCAGYASASFSLFRVLDIKAGARYEYTQVRIDYPGTTIPSYGIVTPTVLLSHTWGNGQTLKLAYTRRIERAEYDQLNPFVNRSDPYNLVTGNPSLKPEIGNNAELGYSKNFGKGASLNVSLIERINTQDHKRVVNFYSEYQVGDSLYHNVSVQQVQNAGTEYNTGLNASGSASLSGALTVRGTASVFNQYFVPSLAVLGAGGRLVGYRVRGTLNVGYTVANTVVAEAFGAYSAPATNIQGRVPQSLTYTVAVRKQFWNKQASVGVTATNPFSPYIRQVTTIRTDAYASTAERQLPYRSFGISATWRFGKLETKKAREEDNSYLNNPPGTGGN